MFMLSAPVLAAMQTAPVQVRAFWNGVRCVSRVGNEEMDAKQLEAEGASWAREGRKVLVIFGVDTPYRCIGSTLFTLKQTEAAIAGPTEVAEDMVHISAGGMPCILAINGATVTRDLLAERAAAWEKSGTLVALAAGPEADFPCAETMLAALKPYPKLKLGFLGNDVAE